MIFHHRKINYVNTNIYIDAIVDITYLVDTSLFKLHMLNFDW